MSEMQESHPAPQNTSLLFLVLLIGMALLPRLNAATRQTGQFLVGSKVCAHLL
jgi:hypothetical protein